MTDRRTDGRAIAYSVVRIYATCCRALKTVHHTSELGLPKILNGTAAQALTVMK